MKSKLKTKTRHKSATDAEMTNLGYYFSSSSSSSNLSPLAPPFTVERSNPNKLYITSNLDSNFSSKSDGLTTNNSSVWSQLHSSNATQGLDADSIRIATVPDAKSTIKPYYYFNMNSSVESGLQHENQHFFGAKYKHPDPINSRSSTSQPNLMNSQSPYNWSLDRNTINSPSTRNWSSMEPSIKSGLEPVNQSDGHLFGVKQSPPPKTWSFGDDSNDVLPSGSLFRGYMPSQVDYGLGLSGSATYSRQADGSRGKEDYLFGGVSDIARENIRPSIIGKSHDTSFSSTNHGIVSSGFSDEQTITCNGGTSYFEKRPIMLDFSSGYISPSITKSSPSIVIKPSVTVSPFSAQGAVSTKSLESNSTSIFNSNDVLFSHKPLKEKGHEAKDSFLTSNQLSDQRDASDKISTEGRLNFEFKASTNIKVPNINSTKDPKSAANVSEHLDHPNSFEDSPCWKGAPTRYSSSGSSSEADSSQHPMKKQQKINGEEPEMKILSSDGVEDETMHVSVGNAQNLVPTESLDLNVVVKALSNLSQLLLLHSSKDEYGLKEHDHKALADVIHNLNVCVSRKNQQVGPAQNDHERNIDSSTKITVELQGASLRDNDDLPKDYNMIQKIKRLLDENLECKEDEDLSSDTLLYKNLWLETEAELCASSYRARFDRIKREMGKSKASVPDVSEVASDKKKVSTSNLSPIASKLMHEAAASKISKTHEHNPSLSGVNDHIDDVENSVMARFNILKRSEESNPLNLEEKKHDDVQEDFGNEIQSSLVAEEPHWQHHLLGKVNENIYKKSTFSAEVSGKESQSYGIAVGPHFQHLAGKEEEVAPGSGGTSLMHNRFESGPYITYGGSSDWEYVMKI